MLHGDPARHRALFHRLASSLGPLDAPAAAMIETVLARFDRDRATVSEVLEPSVSHDAEGWHLLRFSYAFHGYRRDTAGAAASTLDFVRPFGDDAVAFAAPILRIAEEEPSVWQLMFGYAADAPGRARLKLYLQFSDDSGAAALALTDRVLPGLHAAERFADRRLHLLGVDFEGGELRGAKLYFVEPRTPLGIETHMDNGAPTPRGRVALFDELAQRGITELRDVLWIHRVTPLATGALQGGDHAVEVDFSLADNELRWSELIELPSIARHRTPDSPLVALERDFRLAIRRLSVPVADGADAADKLNVYYMLAEVEPGAPPLPRNRPRRPGT
jgi:hypothetical protein